MKAKALACISIQGNGEHSVLRHCSPPLRGVTPRKTAYHSVKHGSLPVHVYSAAYENVLPHRLRPHPPLKGVEPAHPQSPLQLTQQLTHVLMQQSVHQCLQRIIHHIISSYHTASGSNK